MKPNKKKDDDFFSMAGSRLRVMFCKSCKDIVSKPHNCPGTEGAVVPMELHKELETLGV